MFVAYRIPGFLAVNYLKNRLPNSEIHKSLFKVMSFYRFFSSNCLRANIPDRASGEIVERLPS